MSGGAPVQDADQSLRSDVARHFADLTVRGLSPNAAAALALKLHYGKVKSPVDVSQLQGLAAGAHLSSLDPVSALLHDLFSSAETLAVSFMPTCAAAETPRFIDRALVEQTLSSLSGMQADMLKEMHSLSDRMLASWQSSSSNGQLPDEHFQALLLRAVSILLLNPWVDDDQVGRRLLVNLMDLVGRWLAPLRQKLVTELAQWSTQQMQPLIIAVEQHLTITYFEHDNRIDAATYQAVKFLSIVAEANDQSKAVSYTKFYLDIINSEDFDVKRDYVSWKRPGLLSDSSFSFCHYPFVYDPASKSDILAYENTGEMREQFHDAIFESFFTGGSCPYLVLRTRRSPYLVHDTLLQIQNASANNTLKRPLKVQFIGEQGVDEGGVQKEFFQLLMRDMFDTDYGMFKLDEETRMYWFRASKIDMTMEFELVGTMIGLAIYNSHLLEFSFPMLTYRKLMGHKPTLQDLQGVHPTIHASLQKLLTQDNASQLGLVFQVEQEADFGEGLETLDLEADGANKAVTDDNKQHYVDLYVRHLLETSIKRQFDAFQRGFKRLCGGPALKLFRAEELEKLICGSQSLDFLALEKHTRYDDGYSAQSQVVKWFWEVVHGLPQEQQKQLLFFVTGSDRVPIKGLASLTPPFTISRAGPHSDRLPTAHTCFNHLLLPDYQDLESMRGRLLLSIQNSEGFGLM
ncbi:hypothetical protein ABBQ38_008870 [Trebouxia sp. C0009 RCD-2024]